MSFTFMHKSQASCQQKRKSPGALQNNITKPQVKRQKLNHRKVEPEANFGFWDNLSKVWLTRGALRELDRRNESQAAYQRAQATRRENHQTASSIKEFYSNCDACDLKNLNILAKKGGPDLSDIKGYPQPFNFTEFTEMSSSQANLRRKRGSRPASSTKLTGSAKPPTDTKKTDTSGPYDKNFLQLLIDSGIYSYAYRTLDGEKGPKPNNWHEINLRLKRHRPSLSPSAFSNKDFEEFEEVNTLLANEKKVTNKIMPFIAGKSKEHKYIEEDIYFTNFAPLIEDNLTTARPDVYYGASPQQIRREIRDKLSDQIIPSKQKNLPMLPNFFLEAKGPDGSMAVADRQACYDGTLGARAMLSLRSYGQEKPVYDNNSYTITSTYCGGMLKLYTTHPVQSDSHGGRPEYYMTHLRSFAMSDTVETFREGATAFRNARDLAKEWRDEAINQANERALHGEPVVLDTNFGLTYSSTTASSSYGLSVTGVVRQESRTSLNDRPSIDDHEDSESSPDPIAPENRIPVKRSNRELKRAYRRQHRQ